MEQHPIPQQISSYQFRLVGDMTLKQFFQLAGGAVVSLIFYSTPLHPLIKWPLMIFFALAGVALAFLPFEDRPLEKWVIAFFRSIYSPTIYTWKKPSTPTKYFKDEVLGGEPEVVSGAEPAKVDSYLSEAGGTKTSFAKKLDSYEKNFLSGLGSLFGATTIRTTPAAIERPPQPSPAPQVAPMVPQATTTEGVSPLASKGFGAAAAAEFSSEAAPPAPPTVANTVTGQVLDSAGKIVEAAILEIRDAAGRPVRALRTNKLGHFTVVTPLTSGPYELSAEKEGLEFGPVRFDALGEIIPPIVVRAEASHPKQSTINNQQPVAAP